MDHPIELMEQKIAVSELVQAIRDGWPQHVAITRAVKRLIASGFGREHSERTVQHALTLI